MLKLHVITSLPYKTTYGATRVSLLSAGRLFVQFFHYVFGNDRDLINHYIYMEN